MIKPLHVLRHQLSLRFTRLRDNREGVAAVEFALILPLMLAIYLGAAELTQLLMAEQRLVIVSRTAADLVAQEPTATTLTDSQLSNVYAAAAAVLAPFSSTPLKLTLTSVNFVADTGTATGYDAEPQWTVVYQGSTPRPCKILTTVVDGTAASASTLPAGIYGEGSVIIADATYTYTPTIGGSLLAWSTSSASISYSQTNYLRPRNVTTVPYTPGVGTVCPAY